LTSTDLQNLLPKTAEVGRTQEIQDRRNEAGQLQAAERFSIEVEGQTKKVHDPTRAQGNRIEKRRRDEAKKGGGGPGEKAGGRADGAAPDGDAAGSPEAAGTADARSRPGGELGHYVDVRV
jgi:hypothetical protein